MSIYNKGVMNDEDHIRIIDAVWNTQGQRHPSHLGNDSLYAVSGFVLVFDNITKEDKCYWGSFAADRSHTDILEDARHIAKWGYKVSDAVRDAFFPYMKDKETV